MKQKPSHNSDNSLSLDNLVRQREQRAGDFKLLEKVLALPSFQEDPGYGINDQTRAAFVGMQRQLKLVQVVLTTKQRAWAHRLIQKLSKRLTHTKKVVAATGDRSPIVVSKEANRAMRKIDRWLEQQRGGSVPTATEDRSPVAPISDKPKHPSDTKRDTKRKRLAKRRENRLDRWIDTHPSTAPTTPPGCP